MKHAAILTALIFAVCILITTGCSLIPQNVALNSAQPQYSSTTYDEKNPGHPDFIDPVISDNWFIVEQVGRDLDKVQPMGVAYCNGKIFVCDTPENKIKVFDTEFNFLYSIGSLGNEVGSFLNPSDIAIYDGKAYILDSGNNRLQILELDGTPVSSEHLFNFSSSHNEYYSHLAILSPNEIVFTVQDTGEKAKIYRMSNQEINPIYDTFMGSVYAWDGKTYAINLYEFTKMSIEETVAESGENSLLIFDGDKLESQITLPYMYSIADFVIDDGQLYVLSYLWNRLDHFDLQGNYIETLAQFSFDSGKSIDYKSYLAFDKESSTFYITADDNSVIYEVQKKIE